MYTETINKCAANAARIVRLAKTNPIGFWLSSAMAGAYVGLGIILIFTLGNLLDPSVRPLVMGATFGIALTLVVIAGSELFTGHTMFLTFGVQAKKNYPLPNVVCITTNMVRQFARINFCRCAILLGVKSIIGNRYFSGACRGISKNICTGNGTIFPRNLM